MQAIRSNPKTLALALGALLAGGMAVAPAFAQDAGTAAGSHFSVVGGYAHEEPTGDGTIAGSKAEFAGSGAATLGLNYDFNDKFSLEAWGAATKFEHRVTTAADGKVATVDAQPYALSGQYHFRNADATVRPFVGLGYFQENIDKEDQDNAGPYAANHIGMTTAQGPMATVGMDLNFTPHMFARIDARYLHGSSDIAVDGTKVGDADLNPVIVGAGVGVRF
jgi:outer membrane protein